MRRYIRSRFLIPVAATLLATPLAAQVGAVVQHCVMVTQCTTVTTTVFGIVLSEEESCETHMICHYH